MKDFLEFMKSLENSVALKSQSERVKGWVYEGIDGKQMAYWICERDGVSLWKGDILYSLCQAFFSRN